MLEPSYEFPNTDAEKNNGAKYERQYKGIEIGIGSFHSELLGYKDFSHCHDDGAQSESAGANKGAFAAEHAFFQLLAEGFILSVHT